MKTFIAIPLFSILTFFSFSGWNTNNETADNTTKTEITPQGPKVGPNIGNIAPDIAMKSPDGKVLKLSDLRGKMVLVDFWASWCGPCRRENPNVVAAYNQFKDMKFKNGKSFDIYSVSLDKSVNNWKNAIKQDKLAWPNHVSDLLGWGNKAAAAYGVRGIPANVLIDADGLIVAKNLRGQTLVNTLKSLAVK